MKNKKTYTGQAYMIKTAPEAPEFANSISISVGNLGISPGTSISGLSIAHYGLHSAPWVDVVIWRSGLD